MRSAMPDVFSVKGQDAATEIAAAEMVLAFVCGGMSWTLLLAC